VIDGTQLFNDKLAERFYNYHRPHAASAARPELGQISAQLSARRCGRGVAQVAG
jgi:hypothetical protein